jgi:hypothetical protein
MRPCALSPPRLPTHKLSGSPCMLHRATSTGRAASQAIAAPSYEAAEQQLREWVRSQGGYVHPHLGVADPAPCGVRGIVAVQPIALEDLEKGPVISIPAHLHLTNSVAIDILQQAASAAAAETGSLDPVDIAALAAQHHLSHMQLIGAALALESNKGSSSMWAPYLQVRWPGRRCGAWSPIRDGLHLAKRAGTYRPYGSCLCMLIQNSKSVAQKDNVHSDPNTLIRSGPAAIRHVPSDKQGCCLLCSCCQSSHPVHGGWQMLRPYTAAWRQCWEQPPLWRTQQPPPAVPASAAAAACSMEAVCCNCLTQQQHPVGSRHSRVHGLVPYASNTMRWKQQPVGCVSCWSLAYSWLQGRCFGVWAR